CSSYSSHVLNARGPAGRDCKNSSAEGNFGLGLFCKTTNTSTFAPSGNPGSLTSRRCPGKTVVFMRRVVCINLASGSHYSLVEPERKPPSIHHLNVSAQIKSCSRASPFRRRPAGGDYLKPLAQFEGQMPASNSFLDGRFVSRRQVVGERNAFTFVLAGACGDF